jgi:succinoglycan biosynthesis transport protein ExoP
VADDSPGSPDFDGPGDIRPAGPRGSGRRLKPAEQVYGYGYEGAGEEAGAWVPDIRHYLGVVSKRRWPALLAFVVVMAYVAFNNYTAIPIYQSSARVLVESDNVSLNPFAGRDFLALSRSMQAELAILESRQLAKRTVAALGLEVSAPAAGVDETNAVVQSLPAERSPWQRVWLATRGFSARAFGIGAPPEASGGRNSADGINGATEATPFGETLAEARRLDGFLGGLSVSSPAEANGVVIDVNYQTTEAELAARFANAHAQEYINQSIERRFTSVDELTQWLTDSIAAQQVRLSVSLESLARFREDNELTTIDGTSPTIIRLNELAGSLTRAQAQRLEEDATYNQALALRSDPESFDRLLAGTDPTLQSRQTELAQLRRRQVELSATLRPRHPDMVALDEQIRSAVDTLERDRDRLLEALRQDVLASQATEASLSEALDQVEADAVAQGRKGVQLSALSREAESNQDIFDLLMQRSREADVTREQNPVRVRILDLALVPTSPVSPDRQRNFLRGLAGAVMLSLAVVFGLERIDSRIRTPDELRDHLDLSYIGLLPEVETKDQVGPLLAVDGELPQFSEELRHIRTNILFSFSGDEPRSLTVTSASPNEGKTTVATNLAAALAQTGEQVLLVDADLRRPSVHDAFSLPLEPGLSNLLVGNAKPSQAIRRTTVKNLSVLVAGHRPPNPSELLGSRAFQKFLVEFGRHFSWIVLDTPPVIAVTDACLTGNVTSGVLFVVGSDRVSRQVARRAVDQIRTARGTLVGGVLNHVAVNRHRHYYAAYAAYADKQYQGYYLDPSDQADRAETSTSVS